MDTFKDKQTLDEIHARGQAPWQVWDRAARSATLRPLSDVPPRAVNGGAVAGQ
jgi:hypothetical protein